MLLAQASLKLYGKYANTPTRKFTAKSLKALVFKNKFLEEILTLKNKLQFCTPVVLTKPLCINKQELQNSMPQLKIYEHSTFVNANGTSFCNPRRSFITQKRFYHSSRRIPKTPELIYVPQIMKWLKNKIKFKVLKSSWDPEFSEGAFIYGTTKAVCRITDIIHEDKPEQLEKLLTFSAKMKLMDYMTTRLTKVQKEIILLKPDDIKILVPLNVVLSKDGNKKTCRVTLRVLGLKWHEHARMLRLVLVALQTEFLRDYSQGHKDSEWTISAFDVLECGMLTQIPS